MTKHIMLQGTSSHVGKSILTTALCRIFYQDGLATVPFKAQNMALNSYVTKDGGEMGRSQVAQAEAAGLEPFVEMNPVLLKPTGNACSQVILMGKSIGNMSAREYHKGYSLKAFDTVKEAIRRIESKYDMMVIEGAGSPAEVNLKANDIVNMRIAKYLKAPVLLIADIDRGGAMASLVGTLELLDPDERDLVKGLVINKFRGDVTILQPALDFLEEKTGKPVLGVIPYLPDINIEDEDSVSLDDKKAQADDKRDAALKIAVIQTPKISNFTDFDALSKEADVDLYYIGQGEHIDKFGKPDLILLPGSKNTTEDMLYLRRSGLEAELNEAKDAGTPIIGICGGYQMLGEKISDPLHTESDNDSVKGLGFLPMETTFAAKKLTSQVKARCLSWKFLGTQLTVDDLYGYEIHMGETKFTAPENHPFEITERAGKPVQIAEGMINDEGTVMGAYIHGIFDSDSYRRAVLNILRSRKGLASLPVSTNYAAAKQAAYNRLADTVRRSLDMEKVYKIINESAKA